MFYVGILWKLNVNSKIMDLFFSSILQSVFSFAICCWYGNSTLECKSKIGPIINNCRRFNVNNTTPLLEMYKGAVVERSNVTINDPSHPVHSGYNKSPAGTRWTAVQGRPARYRGTCPSNQYWTLFNWCKWSWYTGRPPIHLLPTALLERERERERDVKGTYMGVS